MKPRHPQADLLPHAPAASGLPVRPRPAPLERRAKVLQPVRNTGQMSLPFFHTGPGR